MITTDRNATDNIRELLDRNKSTTPRSDNLEATRIALKQERTPAYGDALNLCRHLEDDLYLARIKILRLEKQVSDYGWESAARNHELQGSW